MVSVTNFWHESVKIGIPHLHSLHWQSKMYEEHNTGRINTSDDPSTSDKIWWTLVQWSGSLLRGFSYWRSIILQSPVVSTKLLQSCWTSLHQLSELLVGSATSIIGVLALLSCNGCCYVNDYFSDVVVEIDMHHHHLCSCIPQWMGGRITTCMGMLTLPMIALHLIKIWWTLVQ